MAQHGTGPVRWTPLPLLTALLAAVLPVRAGAQQPDAPPDTVRLRFAWPAGTIAAVETSRFRERIAERTDTLSGGATYRMQVREHDDGLAIIYDSLSITAAPRLTGDFAALQAAAEQLVGLVANYVVSRDGEFLRIQDVATIKARIDSLFAPVFAGVDSTGQAHAVFQSMLSEQALQALAAQEWNALVGMWGGAELELEAVYGFEEEEPIPLLPGETVRMVSELAIVGRLPCTEDALTPDCVEIQLVSYPDEEAMKAVLRRFMQRVAGDTAAAAFVIEALEIENELMLITEPATLLPHHAVIAKSVRGVGREGGETSEFSQIDVRTYTFTYRR
jgi:hypothetical protein